MNKILLSLIIAAVAQNVFAGGVECDALQEGEVVSHFFVDWEPNGTTLKFDRQVAWYPNALNFEMVYSLSENGKYIYAAVSPSEREQLVELFLDKSIDRQDVRGTMRAGDREYIMKRMAKFKEYEVICR